MSFFDAHILDHPDCLTFEVIIAQSNLILNRLDMKI